MGSPWIIHPSMAVPRTETNNHRPHAVAVVDLKGIMNLRKQQKTEKYGVSADININLMLSFLLQHVTGCSCWGDSVPVWWKS